MEYELKLKEEELNYILIQLSEKPYIQVFELIENIKKQVNKQIES
jgi:hypothetical protein